MRGKAGVWLRFTAWNVVTALVYAIAGLAWLQTAHAERLNLWPPTSAAIALACLILLGPRVLVGVFVGSMAVALANESMPRTVAAGAVISLGNCVAAFGGWWLLIRWLRLQPAMSRLRDVAGLCVVGAGLTPAIASGVGALALVGEGTIAWSEAGTSFVLRWLLNAVGVILILPAVLTVWSEAKWRWPASRRIEAASFGVLLGASLSLMVVGWWGPESWWRGVALVPIAVVVAMAGRLGPSGGAVGSFTAGIAAVIASSLDLGPFAPMSDGGYPAAVWAYLLATPLSSMLVGVHVSSTEAVARRLAERESALAATVQQIPLAVWTTDRDLCVTSSLGRGVGEMSLQSGEPVGRALLEFFGTSDGEAVSEQVHKRALTGETTWHEVSWRGKEFQASVEPLRDRSGRVIGCVGCARDVTRTRRIERAVRLIAERTTDTGEAFFLSLVKTLAEALEIRCAAVGVIEDGRVRALAMWDDGTRRVDADFDVQVEPWSAVCRGESVVALSGLNHGSGLSRWGGAEAFVGVPLLSSDGSVAGLLFVMHDGPIDEALEPLSILRLVAARATSELGRLRVEESLRRSRERLAAIVGNTPNVAICGYDETGRVLYWNEAASRVFGWHEAEAIGRTARELILDDQGAAGFARVLEDVAKTGRPFGPEEWTCRHRDGQAVVVLSTVFMIEGQDGRPEFVCMDVDVTERHRAEEALRRSQAELERAQEVGRVGSWVSGLDLESPLRWSRQTYRIFGVDEGRSLCVRDFVDRVHPDDLDRVREAERTAITQGKVYSVEHRITRPDGEERWVLEQADVVRDVDGRSMGLIGVVHDITQRKRAEAALEQERAFLQQIVDINPNLIFAKDREGRFTFVNRAVAETYGTTVESLLGRTDADFNTNLEEVAFFRRMDEEVMDSLHERFIPEEVITDSTGTRRWLQTVKRPLVGRDGRADVVLGVATDITLRKQVEEALRESEATKEAILRAIPDPIFRIARTGEYLDYSGPPNAKLMAPPERFLGQRVDDIMPPAIARRTMSAVEEALRTGSATFEYSVEPDGAGRTYEVRMVIAGPDEVLSLVRDVTDRKRAEASLRDSEERFRQLAESVEDVFWMRDLASHRLIYLNSAFERIWGMKVRDAMMDVAMWDASIHAADRERVTHDMRRWLDGDGHAPWVSEYRITRPNGQVRWIHDRCVRVHDAQGRAYRIAGVAEDITERKLAEAALRESEDRYRQLFHTNQAVKLLIDPLDGSIIDANEAAARFYQYPMRVLLASRTSDLAANEVTGSLEARIPGEVGIEGQWETEHRLATGATRAVEVYAGPIDLHGRRLVFWIVHDITQRRAAQAEAQQWRARYDAAVKASRQALYDWDTATNEIVWGGAAGEVLGYEPGELATRAQYESAIHGQDREEYRRETQRVLRTGEPFHLEYRIRRKDGKFMDVVESGCFLEESGAVTGGEPKRMVGFVADVTQRRRFERELRQSQKMEAVGHLASGVAHDFNNLLSAIFGHTSLARRTLPEGHPANQSLERVEEAARQASGVTSALLTFARKGPTDKRRACLADIVEQALRLLRRTLPARVELVTHLDDGVRVNADATQLQQVVLNLAINARDAMPAGGTLEITVRGEGNDAVLEVRDTGLGIAPEAIPRVFEPFFTTKARGEGTGLGLAIVHGIVREHAGRVEVSSTVGQGSTFRVFLPRALEQRETPQPDAAPVRGAGEMILLAWGNRQVREIVGSVLRGHGFEVSQVEEPLRLASSAMSAGSRLGLVVIDADLPGQSPWRLVSELRGQGVRVPVIVVSGKETEAQAAVFDRDVVVLRKPFQMSALALAVSEAIRERESLRSNAT